MHRTALVERIAAYEIKPLLAMPHCWASNRPTRGPGVSDDKAYAEPVFRTAKYRPECASRSFADLDAARAWAKCSVHGDDKEHPTAASAASRRNERPALGEQGWKLVGGHRPCRGADVRARKPATHDADWLISDESSWVTAADFKLGS